MPQTERLDWLQFEPPFHGCRISGCLEEAKNYHRGIPYCAVHAREARDGMISADILGIDLRADRQVYLYVLEAQEIRLLKFGKSADPKKRFRQVRDGSPVELELLGYCLDPERGRTEAWIHAYLQAHRTRGEWFRDHADCRQVAALIVGNQPLDLVRMARQ